MYRFKQAALCAIVLTALASVGCTTTTPKPEPIDAQRSAMQRWNACLERNSNSHTMSAMRINQLVNQHCEGYKRDVIAAFPPHMTQQIDQLLIGSAYKLMENNESSAELAAEHGELVKTLLQ